MCGIAGHVGFGRPPAQESLANVLRGIRHRGPDDEGLWISPGGESVLGHTRLSVIDLSPQAHQPMADVETGNCIVFNGEIYNFKALRSDCEAAGDRFRSDSDTEVILALYRRYGTECLHRLRGMFAFAIWDHRRRELFLARDRVGKKPLNFALAGGELIFCSELDPLRRHPAVDTAMDMEALDLYLHLQYIPAPWTIYKGIRKLPPAHFAVFDKSGLRVQKYWDIDYRDKNPISESDALDGLEERLTEAVRLRMIADVPLGALLSGGVDSSVVVALMAKLSGQQVRTYSIGFREEAFNELPYAQQAAEICGTRHHAEIVDGDVEHLIPVLAKHYGEPFGDSSAVPSFLVSKVARSHVTVAMNGDGGDELLGGYPRYQLSRLQLGAASITPDWIPPRVLVSLAARLSTATSVPGRIGRKIVSEYGWPELRSIGMYSGFWSDGDRKALLADRSGGSVLPDWRTTWLKGAIRNSNNSVDRMLWYDSHTYLPGDLLVKMDIASMHCGLETRSPLLDHEVIEYCARLPLAFKVKDGIGKYLLKKLAERHFPAAFVHRQKMGFGIPLADWMRGPLRQVLEYHLRHRDLMWPLDTRLIEKRLDEFLGNGVDHSSRLWALLMYGVWRLQTQERAG